MTFGDGLFMAVAYAGTTLTSPDGITRRTLSNAFTWAAVTFGAGLFVTVAGSGSDRVATSSDGGATWVNRATAANITWTSVTYGADTFVAVAVSGVNNRVMTSGP